MLKDILTLYDTIARDARELYDTGASGRVGARLAFVEGDSKKPNAFKFVFTDMSGTWRLYRGALMPMLGAFRWMIQTDHTGDEYEWRGGFESVKALWYETGSELMVTTRAQSDELGRKLTSLGKSQNLWAYLHSRVANKYLLKAASPR